MRPFRTDHLVALAEAWVESGAPLLMPAPDVVVDPRRKRYAAKSPVPYIERVPSLSMLGVLAAGNDKLFAQLRNGGGCNSTTLQRVSEFFAAKWPRGVPWPPGVPAPNEKAA